MISDLRGRWADLLRQGSAAKQEVDAYHPLRLLFGADDFNRALFAIMARARPAEPELPSDVLETRITVRPDGFHLLVISLKDPALFDVFAQLCGDLATRSHNATSEESALAEVYTALADWKRLLRSRPEHLSVEALRGLVGELWFGLHVLTAERSVADVFDRWRGPFGAHQDFQFAGGHNFEVKAVRRGVDWVQIASEHQLDSLGAPLTLAIVELDDAERTDSGAFCLHDLLAAIRDALAAQPIASRSFEAALSEIGDPFTHSFYAEHWFEVHGCRRHEVSEGFPRLVPSSLPAGVTNVEYRLTAEAMAPFVVAE